MSNLKDCLTNLQTLIHADIPGSSIVYQIQIERDENTPFPYFEIMVMEKDLGSSITGERTYINMECRYTDLGNYDLGTLESLEQKQLIELKIKSILKNWQIQSGISLTDIKTIQFNDSDIGVIGTPGKMFVEVGWHFKMMLKDI